MGETFHICDRGTRWELRDARGIFCCFVCDKCEKQKREKYRVEIFTDPNYETSEAVEEEMDEDEGDDDYAARRRENQG